jgi:cell division protein FtsL
MIKVRKSTGPVRRLKKGDIIFLFIIAVLAIITPVTIIYSSAYLSSTNIEVEKLKKSIEEQENVNAGLSMQVDELASLSHIQDVAKENGLVYNNDNIILIK